MSSHLAQPAIAGAQEDHCVVVNAVHCDRADPRCLVQRLSSDRLPQGQRMLQVGRAAIQLLQLKLRERKREREQINTRQFTVNTYITWICKVDLLYYYNQSNCKAGMTRPFNYLESASFRLALGHG